jgi:hypothetical protein
MQQGVRENPLLGGGFRVRSDSGRDLVTTRRARRGVPGLLALIPEGIVIRRSSRTSSRDAYGGSTSHRRGAMSAPRAGRSELGGPLREPFSVER